MSKQIRPIAKFKKVHPDIYKFIMEMFNGTGSESKKDQENTFYYAYCFCSSGIKAREPDKPEPWNPFYFDSNYDFTRKTLITELGRLLLTGWYYSIQDKAEEICRYVYNSYQSKREQFNESQFTDAVKHIRENIGYYYHNPDELRFYIVNEFFNDRLQPLLPQLPEELQALQDILAIIERDRKPQLKKDKYYYEREADTLKGYADYLQDILDGYGIEYQTKEEYEQLIIAENTEYLEKINKIESEYQEQIRNISPQVNQILLT